ncbi:MAG: hypothetical protein ABI230_08035 [Aestuariivirga sp.]
MSALDLTINDGYHRMINTLGRKTTNRIHSRFLRLRHSCGSNADCIADVGALEMPIFQLADPSFQPPQTAAVAKELDYNVMKKQLKIGECTLSKVVQFGPRLCNSDATGDCPDNLPFDDSGDEINASNGTHGVDYDRVPVLEKSKLGDTVLLCLKSIPTHCPINDDRGYFWTWKNLRTGGIWGLTDSQHMCGGF